jgi:hypothetical protein
MTITDAPLLAPCTRECVLWWSSTLRWPHGYPQFRRRYLWPPSPYLSACPLMLSKRVLWERWSPGSRSEQSGSHILRLLARRSATLFMGRWMAEPIWLHIWRRLPGNFS